MESYRTHVSELQQKLARKATALPTHRFTNLYDLLTWEPLMAWAFDTLMTNRGSRTAGVDGIARRAALKQRDRILADLRVALKTHTYQHQPVRRTYIPKANGKQRPLGIPTLTDRLVQLMVKAILEPIFESDFRPESHGFRPGRSCHTAMAHLHQLVAPRHKKMYWTIEGDITGCFDHVQHTILLRLIKRRVQDRNLLAVIMQMLRAGVMEGTLFSRTTEGTPQGGIVSPLFANIYLHELDVWMVTNYTGLTRPQKNQRRRQRQGNAFYVRYADDFVIAWNGTKATAEHLKAALATFLHDHLGLELSAEKTHITHATDGYDFLGFTVKRRIDPRRGSNTLLIYPSKKSVMKIKAKLKALTTCSTVRASVRDKLMAVNALLRGWAGYFRHSAASQTFSYIAHYAFKRMEIWLRRKTGRKIRAVYARYYRRHDGTMTWYDAGIGLYHPGAHMKIVRQRYAHRPNPYLSAATGTTLDAPSMPETPTWSGAVYYGEDWTAIRATVLERDEYHCQLCGSRSHLEVHHIRKWKPGMTHDPAKLITLCQSCHSKVRNPQSETSRQLARHHAKTGEPDEVKVSRPVREGA